MTLSLSEATEFVKAKTPGLKASLLPYSTKKHVNFYLNYTSFCVFLASFLDFWYSCFISFNFSIFVSLALKIHNCTDLK
jgi:hypothetical protein